MPTPVGCALAASGMMISDVAIIHPIVLPTVLLVLAMGLSFCFIIRSPVVENSLSREDPLRAFRAE